jgi:hypothetical protein
MMPIIWLDPNPGASDCAIPENVRPKPGKPQAINLLIAPWHGTQSTKFTKETRFNFRFSAFLKSGLVFIDGTSHWEW